MDKNRLLIFTIILCMALVLLLTACGKKGETSFDGSNTPGLTDSSTDEPVTKTPDNGSASDGTLPAETPDESNPPNTSTPVVNKAEVYEAGGYVETYKASLDESLVDVNRVASIDIERVIDQIYVKYESYLNVNITKNAIKVAVAYGGRTSPYYIAGGVNLTGISPNALKEVNDFLASKGEPALDEKNLGQNIAALWFAASLYYGPDVDNGYPAYDIANAFRFCSC